MNAPLFIISSGRAGSTIFHRLLCEHPRVGWITELAGRLPGRELQWHRGFMRSLDWPWIGSLAARVYPGECYDFWESLVPGFRRPCRDLTADDVTEQNRSRVRAALQSIPTDSRSLLSLKLTGWPRIGFLAEIFPEAKFVHVIRDGRSVASSFLAVPWWLGWQGPENWRWGPLSVEHRQEWERFDHSFVALAGIQWKIYLAAYEDALSRLGEARLLEVRYEDLCADSGGTFSRVLDFCGLEDNAVFRRGLEQHPMASADEKWRRQLTSSQQEILETVLAGELERRGYSVA